MHDWTRKPEEKFQSQSINAGARSADDCRLGAFILNAHAGMEDQAQGEDWKERLSSASILTGKKREKLSQ